MIRKTKLEFKINLSEFLFFVSYGIYLIINLLRSSFYQKYINQATFKYMMFGCIVILILKEVYRKNIFFKDIFTFVICMGVSFILLKNMNGQYAILPLFALIYSARNIEFKKIAKFTIIFSAFVLLIVIFSAKVNIIENYIYINDKGRVREYLGFRYALYPSTILFNIITLDLYINFKNCSKFRFVFWTVLNCWLYSYTDSRLTFGLGLILILSVFLFKIFPNILKRRKFIFYLLIGSFIWCSIFSISLTNRYNSQIEWMNNLNEVLGNRLELGKRSIEDYGINLLGQKIEYIGAGLDSEGNRSEGTYNYVDCFYLLILQRYGAIFLLIFIIILTLSMSIIYKKKNYLLLFILFILAIHGIIDDLILWPYYNTFWFSISEYLFSNRKVKRISR